MSKLGIIFLFLGVFAFAEGKAHRPDAPSLQNLDLPDLKSAEICLATTQDSSAEKMYWLLTCLDSKRKYLQREKRIASERPVGEDETSYGDLEITVEMQNRGFRLVSTQEGLFFTRK